MIPWLRVSAVVTAVAAVVTSCSSEQEPTTMGARGHVDHEHHDDIFHCRNDGGIDHDDDLVVGDDE